MDENFKLYFKKYIRYIISHYNLSNTEINNIISEKKLIDFIKSTNWRYITQKEINESEVLKKIYERYVKEEFVYDSIKKYFETYIYMDKYWIWDFFLEKDNVYVIDNLYNYKVQVNLKDFMWMNYSIIDRFSIVQDKKFYDVLEFLDIQLKRWNIKVRAIKETSSYENTNNEWVIDINFWKIIGEWIIKEFNKDNSDLFIKEMEKMYLNTCSKDFFVDYLVEINLLENNWSITWLWWK